MKMNLRQVLHHVDCMRLAKTPKDCTSAHVLKVSRGRIIPALIAVSTWMYDFT